MAIFREEKMKGEGVRTREEAASHCAALLLHRPSGAKGAQGTVTFVEYGGRCLGITNQHVIASAHGPEFFLYLRGAVPLPGRLLMASARDNPDLPLDLVLLELDREVIAKGGKRPWPLRAGMLPVMEGSSLLAVGYVDKVKANFVTGRCIGASDRRIILHNGLSEETPEPPLGGMSGGPIFTRREDGLHELAGVIYQGRSSGGEIWIYGFPVNKELMERALKLSSP